MENNQRSSSTPHLAKPVLCDVLIHYGNSVFYPEMFEPIKNNNWEKPKGGLWTSPKKSKWGWKDWCKAENYMECLDENSFILKLNDNAKILKIDNLEDFKNAPLVPALKNPFQCYYLDFEEIAKSYDAIWITDTAVFSLRMNREFSLYSWDCESVLILNKDCFQTQSLAHIA